MPTQSLEAETDDMFGCMVCTLVGFFYVIYIYFVIATGEYAWSVAAVDEQEMYITSARMAALRQLIHNSTQP